MSNEIDGLKELNNQLIILKSKFTEKNDKLKEKNSKKFITFKGFECHTEEDINNIYFYDGCSSSECEKAIEKLNKLLNNNGEEKTKYDYAIMSLSNILYNLQCEIMDGEKNNESNKESDS